MNKEESWDECIETNSSIKISPNKARAKSLIETSSGRIKFLEKDKIEESNANYIFEGYYSSLIEVMHALTFLKGYNVTNHICLGYYLRDILRNNELFRLFDDCRFKRNSLVYYGRRMDFDSAIDAINKCKKLIDEITKIISIIKE